MPWVKCKNCQRRLTRQVNPDYMVDKIAKVCFQNVECMNDKEAEKKRFCVVFKPLEKVD